MQLRREAACHADEGDGRLLVEPRGELGTGAPCALAAPAPMTTSAPPTANASTRSAVRTLSSAVGISVHVTPQGRDREDEPVQVVVDVEVARESRCR